MKKFLAIFAGALLAASAFAFSACGGGSGVVEGNYSEPTSEQLSTAVSEIDSEKAFDGLGGLEFDANINAKYSADGQRGDGNVKLAYKLAFGDNAAAGAGDASVKINMNDGGTNTNSQYSAEFYNDSQYVYANVKGLSASAQDSALKVKINFMTLLEDVMVRLPMASDVIASDPAESDGAQENVSGGVSADTLANMLEKLDEYKVKVGLDNENGFKLKISATEETLWLLIEESSISDENIAELKEAITFNKFVADVYFALDADGAFRQFSVNLDIDIFGDGAKMGEAGNNLTLKLNGYITVKAFGGEVKLPEGIDTDPTRIDLTDMLGGGSIPGLPAGY